MPESPEDLWSNLSTKFLSFCIKHCVQSSGYNLENKTKQKLRCVVRELYLAAESKYVYG